MRTPSRNGSVVSIEDQLIKFGLDRGLWIDLASVSEGLRNFGLLHVPVALSSNIDEVLDGCRLARVHSRRLRRSPDSTSQDGVFYSTNSNSKEHEDDWIEVWFAKLDCALPSLDWLERNTGEALGYPNCCVSAHVQPRSLSNYYSDYVFSESARFWEINRLATLFTGIRLLPDFLPCSMTCEAARTLAGRCLSLASNQLGEGRVAEWKRVLQAPLTVWDDTLVMWPNWYLEDSVLLLETRGVVSRKLPSIAQMIPPSWIHSHEPWLVPFHHIGTVCEMRMMNAAEYVSNKHSPEQARPKL